LRLLDSVAQSTAPFLVRQSDGTLWQLTAASDFARPVARCPLRYVLDDELVRACIELAYSGGAELSGCLDLLRFPAAQLWVEWREAAQRESLARVLPGCVPGRQRSAERAGVLIATAPGGRAATLRSFWLTSLEPREPLVSAVETLLDLDADGNRAPPEEFLADGGANVYDPQDPHLNELLRCARFRADSAWRRYYGCALSARAAAAQVARLLVAGVVFDIPMLLALLLLISIRADLVRRAVSPERLNHKRARLGKHPLLEHIEVSVPLLVQAAYHDTTRGAAARSGPRLHHVRGHIVRRRNTVYWRGPHWRGHLRLGQVRSRTVELRLHG
jgi:hypothetical protein